MESLRIDGIEIDLRKQHVYKQQYVVGEENENKRTKGEETATILPGSSPSKRDQALLDVLLADHQSL